jgi:hypothetical protein
MPYKDPEKKREYQRKALKKFRKTEKGKEVHRKQQERYRKKHKNYMIKYRKAHKEEIRKQRKKYKQSKEGKNHVKKSIAKRKRQLGFTILYPLAKDEVAHHITNEHVLGIPKRVHESFSGHSRIIHRELVLEWLRKNDECKYSIAISRLAEI